MVLPKSESSERNFVSFNAVASTVTFDMNANIHKYSVINR